MGFSLSPSVTTKEIDLTTSVPAIATSIGGMVGAFAWGPVEEITLVSRESDIVSKFYEPNDSNYKDWFTAANFLAYSNNLKIVRVVGTGALNATDSGTGILIKNVADFESQLSTLQAAATDAFIAKYPGTEGNDIVVDVADSANFSTWAYSSNFEYAPSGTEFFAVVLKGGTLVEKFIVDKTPGTKNFQGDSVYCEDVFSRQSDYVWCVNSAALITDNAGASVTYTLSGGADGSALVDADYRTGLDLFADADVVDVNLLMLGGAPTATGAYLVQTIAEGRKDCVGFLSPDEADVVNPATTPESELNTLRTTGDYNFSSSYGFLDGNYKYQYDRYNDVYRWVPLNGDIAGLCARTDYVADAWYSPGGFNRGQIKNVVKLAYNPTKAQRDELYKISINPIVSFAGEGTVLYGDKTMQTKPSAFDRINVRRLFIVLEKAIATAAKYSMFEFNDAFTRARFVQMVEPFLREVQGRRGVYDFKVICDETNNTGQVIDNNEFVADILVKPSRSINFITLNFTAVKTAVNFEEVIG